MLVRLFLFLFILSCLLPVKAHALIDAVQGTNYSDVTLPVWNIGDPSLSASVDVCIYSLVVLASPDYAVTITSLGGYFLNNGSNKIPYSLYWEDSGAGNLGNNSGTQLSNGIKLANRNNANILSANCSLGLPSGPTARLYIKITQADMNAALAGTYTGTITIMISTD